MANTVLDSSAVLSLLFDEPSAEIVEQILADAAEEKRDVLITAVNWAEVLYRVHHILGTAGIETAQQFEKETPIKIAEVTKELAEIAARLKASHRLALADAFCAALAKHHKAVLVTGDPDFEQVKGHVKKIVWLRK